MKVVLISEQESELEAAEKLAKVLCSIAPMLFEVDIECQLARRSEESEKTPDPKKPWGDRVKGI